jgi:hypothetical protein
VESSGIHFIDGAQIMAANLVSLIMQSVTPSMIANIASMLGIDRDNAQKAISAGIPAILASFANVASKPGGGQQLSSAMAQQSGVLDQIKGAIGSGGQKAPAENGTDMLSSLLGGGALTALAGVVGRFAGIDPATSKSLLGMLGPVTADVVGQQQRASGLDANGLASLLTSQKDQIAAAMPPGFSNLLSGTGLLDGFGNRLRSGAAAAAGAADRVSDMSGYAAANAGQAARSASSSAWPYWVGGLAALALLGWYLLAPKDNQNVAETPVAPRTETTGTGTPDSRLTNITAELTSSVGMVRSTLQDITDPASARAALPKLEQATAQLDNIKTAVSQLPPGARQGVSSLVERSMPMLNQLCDKVLSTPQTAQLMKPTIDGLRSRLDALARS